jgi:hypothetical protein
MISLTQDHDRKKTDIFCTIIGALYALTLLILAYAFINTGKSSTN